MFKNLSLRLTDIGNRLRGRGRLSHDNISDAVRDVRRALLEADVALPVLRGFICMLCLWWILSWVCFFVATLSLGQSISWCARHAYESGERDRRLRERSSSSPEAGGEEHGGTMSA